MLLITAALVTLAAILAVSYFPPQGGPSAANLGRMSEHWLAENRNQHSD